MRTGLFDALFSGADAARRGSLHAKAEEIIEFLELEELRHAVVEI